jgi:hypothetical protein
VLAEVGPPFMLSLDVAGYCSVSGPREAWRGSPGRPGIRSLAGICIAACVASQPVAAVSQPSRHAADGLVVEVALRDLLSARGTKSPLAFLVEGREVPCVSEAPSKGSLTQDEVLLNRGRSDWRDLGEADYRAVELAAVNLAQRGRGKGAGEVLPLREEFRCKAPGAPSNQGVFSLPKRSMAAWLPGYSRDGSLAVVRLFVPWSLHHADVLYVMKRQGGTWKILVREYAL